MTIHLGEIGNLGEKTGLNGGWFGWMRGNFGDGTVAANFAIGIFSLPSVLAISNVRRLTC